jgi:uncharacterized protein YggE
MAAATVTVRGEAVVRGKPDRVELSLEVSALEQSVDAALTETAKRSEALEEVLREVGVSPDDYTTTGVFVQEEREYERERTVHRGYRARDQVVVRLPDPSVAGSLMRLATEHAAARIAGPRWRIDSSNPARAEACRQAAADARRRAEAYAQTLGVRIGAIVEINEAGVRLRGPYGHLPSGFALAASGEEPEVELHPGNLDVAAEVEVTFALEQE